MKKLFISTIFLFIASLGYSQYIHDLFPCRDSSGARVEGCFAWSDSQGQYIQVTDTSFCLTDTLIVQYRAVNNAWGYDVGEIVMRDTLLGQCDRIIDTTSLSNRIDAIDFQDVTDNDPVTTNSVTVGGLDITTVSTDSDNSATGILVHDEITSEVEKKAIGENEIVFGTANGGVESSSSITVTDSTLNLVNGDLEITNNDGIYLVNKLHPRSNSNGSSFVAIGDRAGEDNISGSSFVALGDQAGRDNVSGLFWNAIGFKAAKSNIDGSNWFAMGAHASENGTNNSNFVAIGVRAANKTQYNNYVAIGAFAATDGQRFGGVSIGSNSAEDVNGNPIAIGLNAARYDVSIAKMDSLIGGVYIGNNVRGTNQAQNEIAIGKRAEGQGSNTASIGNGLDKINEFHAGNVGFDVSTTPTDGDIYKYDSGSGLFELVQPASDSIHGWAEYSDTIYTTSNRLSIAPGDTVTLANNAGETITSHLPLGVTSLYNATDTLITPDRSGDSYNIRVDFTASSSSNDGYFSLVLDIGGSQGIILSSLKTFPKGFGIKHDFSTTSAIYTLDTFIANGGKLKIIGEVGTTEIWDINLVIIRTSRARN